MILFVADVVMLLVTVAGFRNLWTFRYFQGSHGSCKVLKNEERKIRPWKVLNLDICPEKSWKSAYIYNGWPIESRISSIKWRHFQWSWTTPIPSFKVTPIFDAEYLRNGTRYRHSCNEILIGTYALLKIVILNDLEWLSTKFNDMRHHAVYLRQLSFLFMLTFEWEPCTLPVCHLDVSLPVVRWLNKQNTIDISKDWLTGCECINNQ